LEIRQRYTLGKTEKLKSRKLIEQLFKQGISFSIFPLRVICIYNADEKYGSGIQAGFSVSSKNFKNATNRNRIKRLMREAYRLQKNELTSTVQKNNKRLAIFFIYTGSELPQYNLIFEKIGVAIQRVQKNTNEAVTANM